MCDYCSWIDQILARISTETKPHRKKRHFYVDPVIVVHGGAGKIPRKMRNRMLLDVKNAAIESYSDLINGGTAIDAAERAVCYMESKPFFNCGKGGSLDINNEVVMDAGIMTMHDIGCVGAVRDIEHPVTLARKVLEKTNQVLIVESGAQRLALSHGIPILQPGMLNICESITSSEFESHVYCTGESDWKDNDDREKNCDSDCVINRSDEGEKICDSDCVINGLDEGEKYCDSDCVINGSDEEEAFPCYMQSDSTDILDEPMVLQVGAVGVVAYDRKKRLVSATSTAGEPGKPIGLISATSTVIGCGIYTDEKGCVSVSGNDTSIYCYAPARRIIKKLSDDTSIENAVNTVLQNFKNETKEPNIGAIAIDAKGEPCISFNCTHFPWAYCKKGYIYYGCMQNEKYWEKVNVLERPLDCMCISSSGEE